MNPKKAFTIIELLFVILIVSFLVPTIFTIYNGIQKQKIEIDVKQKLMFQGYELFEKLNVLIKDYTIDYEEYFNRSMIGCSSPTKVGDQFKWEVNNSGYCSEFTSYGNANRIYLGMERERVLYYFTHTSLPQGKYDITKYRTDWKPILGRQPFGQYAKLFFDVKNDTDLDGKLEGDSDDEDLGTGLQAIQDPDNIQELYLISLDGKERLFLRRKLVKQEHLTGEINDTSRPYLPEESLYTLQILRLKGFDAGKKHNFGIIDGNTGLYDGVIDTWACDASQGFFGHGQSVSGAYKDYKLPNNVDDCRVDLYQSTISLLAWKISISPRSDPNLAWNQQEFQIHPFLTLFTYNGLYRPAWKNVSDENIMNFFFPLKTTLNIKTSYLE